MKQPTAIPSPSRTRMLALAGIVGPVLFTLLVIPQSLLQPDYSDMALPISALAAWPLGWVQILNFCIFGLLLIAFATGLHLGMRPGRGGALGPVLLALSGIGVLLAATFPWRSVGGDFQVPVGHRIGAVLTFAGAGLGLIVVALRMRGDPHWRNLAGLAVTAGVIMTVLFIIIGTQAVADTAPLHPWAGLLQRITLAVWFPCTVVLAIRLRRVMSGAELTTAESR